MDMLIAVSIVAGSIIIAYMTYRAIRVSTATLFQAIVRHAFVSNFSRFGDFSDMKVAIVDEETGYYVREGALWTVEVQNDELLKSTARPVDMFDMDEKKLKEVMFVVDVLNTDLHDQFVDDEDDE
jgi:hypothetical protein